MLYYLPLCAGIWALCNINDSTRKAVDLSLPNARRSDRKVAEGVAAESRRPAVASARPGIDDARCLASTWDVVSDPHKHHHNKTAHPALY